MKKRSKSLSLVLMGSLTLGVAGCGDEKIAEEFKAYRSIDECARDGDYSQQECRDMAVAAVKQNPRFADQTECEKEFGAGNCRPADAADAQQLAAGNGTRRTGMSWMPLMAGYMMGRYMGASGPMYGAQPLYNQPQQPGAAARSSGGFATSYRTAGGGTVTPDATGKIANPPSSVRQGFAGTARSYAPRAGGVSRGGFSGGTSGS